VTPREAAINLANCIMGAGALSLPSFFKSTGAVLGVALLLASCAWTWFSAVMMVKAADAVSVRVLDGVPVSSYEELMDLTLGRNGKRLSAVGILLLQIGCLVGYANILADVASPFAISVLPPGLEPNRGAVLAAVTLGAMLPIGVAVGGDGGSAGL
jgi:sodium-coupled neutral amino acid transporter 10